jgi:hypothetical protein
MNKSLALSLIAYIFLVAGLLITPYTTGYLRMEAQAQKTILTTAATTPKVKTLPCCR